MILFFRNDRQQKVGLARRAGVNGHLAAEHIARPISRIIVPEWTNSGPYPAVGIFRTAGLAGVNIVFAADRQRDAISGRYDDAGRPDLDIDLVDLPRLERLHLVMGV